jgi:hypothetical protein
MKRRRVGVQLLTGMMCLLINACATSRTVEDTVYADGPRGTVLLQRVDDSWFKTAHPVSVSPVLLTHVLRGVQVQSAPDDQTTALRVFSEEEIAFLSPLMSTALSKATKSQLVAFRVRHGSGPGSNMTGGLLFTRGRLLHLWVTHYRANEAGNESGTTLDRQARNPRGLNPRQLRFVPDTAQRSSHNQHPDVVNPPPLATLVIDYFMLAAALNLPAEVGPSQPLPGDGPPPSHARETQTLKDVVKEQAIELDTLKEEMRALRRKLSEMERSSPNP